MINKFDSSTTLYKEVIETTETIASNVNSRVFKNKIRQSVLLSENILEHKGITDYARKSIPARNYSRFVNEFEEAINEETQ